MNDTASNPTAKPWREVLHVESSAPTVEAIHEHFRERVKEADARRHDGVAELNLARSEALKELCPEDL